MTPLARITLTLLTCLALAGCGGSDGNSSKAGKDSGGADSPAGETSPAGEAATGYNSDQVTSLLKDISISETKPGKAYPTDKAGLDAVLERVEGQALAALTDNPGGPISFTASVGDMTSPVWGTCTSRMVIRFVVSTGGQGLHVVATDSEHLWSLMYDPRRANAGGFDEFGYADADGPCLAEDPAKYGTPTVVTMRDVALD